MDEICRASGADSTGGGGGGGRGAYMNRGYNDGYGMPMVSY